MIDRKYMEYAVEKTAELLAYYGFDRVAVVTHL